jgi:hypothetical protein
VVFQARAPSAVSTASVAYRAVHIHGSCRMTLEVAAAARKAAEMA